MSLGKEKGSAVMEAACAMTFYPSLCIPTSDSTVVLMLPRPMDSGTVFQAVERAVVCQIWSSMMVMINRSGGIGIALCLMGGVSN